MACVVKCGPPAAWRWRLFEFENEKSMFFLEQIKCCAGGKSGQICILSRDPKQNFCGGFTRFFVCNQGFLGYLCQGAQFRARRD